MHSEGAALGGKDDAPSDADRAAARLVGVVDWFKDGEFRRIGDDAFHGYSPASRP